MWRKMLLGLGLGVLVAGCATPGLPRSVNHEGQSVTATLHAKGKLFIAQKIKRKKVSCTNLTPHFRVSLYRARTVKTLPVHRSCKIKKGYLIVYPRHFLKKGDYTVEVRRTKADRYFKGKPQVWAQYPYANFNSGEDKDLKGATVMEGERLEGTVNYSVGDRRDWIQLKGENAVAKIRLAANGKKNFSAIVYRKEVGTSVPQKIGYLAPGRQRRYRIDKDNVYLKIVSKKHAGEGRYVVTRQDTVSRRLATIPVLDSYHVSEGFSVVLLESIDGLKVDTRVSILGTDHLGKNISLGKCSVTSIEEGQASCRLGRNISPRVVELRARARLEG